MRWSMARKIYAIIVMLLVVAVIIVGIGIHSIRQLNTTLESFGLQAKRTVSLNVITRLALERRMATLALVQELDEGRMQAIFDNNMKAVEAAMDAEIRTYEANFPPNPPPTLPDAANTLKRNWTEYVNVTNEVARLSMENSNQKAAKIAAETEPFWDGVDADLAKLAAQIAATSKDPAKYVPLALNSRSEILRFRLILDRYVNEHDVARMDQLEKMIERIVVDTNGMLKGLVVGLTPADGLSLATEIEKKVETTGTDVVKRVTALARQRSNYKAEHLLETQGVPIRLKLADFINGIVGVAMKEMDEGIQRGAALGKRMNTLMIIVSAVGIVIGLALSIRTVRRITRGLNTVIASLNESSSQVNSAASQISDSSQSLAEGSTEQAASLEETSSALEQMASMTRQNADNASKTNATTQNNNRLIATGSTAVAHMSEAMNESWVSP